VRVALLLSILLASRLAYAGDPDQVWRSIETDHFMVSYYEPHLEVARKVAVAAEHAYRTVTRALRHTPEEKTLIVLLDNTDGANGFASVSPRNTIFLFASAPSGVSVLNDHDDWLYGLVLHEYSHIVHLDTVGGLPYWWNRLWGKIWVPNQIQPRWFIEGLATYEESKRTSSGRTRSAIFDMTLRMSVLEGKAFDIATISTGPLAWPHGNVAYLYGSHFLKFLADRYGDDKLALISHAYGRHPIPWNMGKAVREALGKNVDEVYDEWREALVRRYALQKAAVDRRGRVDGRQLTATAEANQDPRYTPDGKGLVWQRYDGYSNAHHRWMPVGGDASVSRELLQIDGGNAFSFAPDGSVVMARALNYRANYDFQDLVRWDPETKAVTRLTWGQRALDPDVSPDGKRIAFSLNGGSQMVLAVMANQVGAEPEIVWRGDRYDQAQTPAWSPDGKKLAFSAWTTGGFRDLFVLDLATRQVDRLMRDRAIDMDPAFTPDGLIVYSSDRSGIYNLYAIDPATRETWQLTNVLGGAFTPDVSPDGKRVAYMGYHADGFEVYELELDRSRWTVPEPYVNDRPDPVVVRMDEVKIEGPRDYRPLETLAPRSWDARLSLDSFGDSLSVGTAGGDVAGHHGWNLGATLGFTRGDMSFGGGYAYNRLWPSLGVGFGRSIGQPGGLFIDGRSTRYTEESWAIGAGLSLPVVREPSLSSDLSFSYDRAWLRNVDGMAPLDPNMAVPFGPETGKTAGVSVRWSFQNVKRFIYTIGPQEGRGLFFSVRYDHPNLGSDFESFEVGYRWQEYWGLPIADHSVALRVAGGIEETNRGRDGSYALGGQGRQDVVQSIRDSTRASATAVLRGYEPASLRGRQFHLLNFEYRVPLFVIEEGLGSVPVYVRRLHLAALVDAGNAFDGAFDPRDLRVALGGSLRLDVVFGFFAGGSFDLGYARGVSEGGSGEWWFLLSQGI
jgi:hypothetical protein